MKKENEKNITKSSWCDGVHVHANVTDNLTRQSKAWSVNEKDMSHDFRNCLNYNRTYDRQNEGKGLKISVSCRISNFKSCNSTIPRLSKVRNCQYNQSEMTIQIQDNHFSKDIRVDLMCIIENQAISDQYLFIQPVILPHKWAYTSTSEHFTPPHKRTTQREAKSRNEARSNTVLLAIVGVLLLVTATTSFVFYYRKKKESKEKREMREILSTQSSNIKMELNPVYSPSISSIGEDDDLPEWLHDRKEMIYDASCIEKGLKLGHGNFGTVFEGKIHLGNAVYVIVIFKIQVYFRKL